MHAFDPSVGTLPIYAGAKAGLRPPISFHKQALGPWSGHSSVWMLMETLTDSMKRLGHDYVDVLKVDVEGDEWQVFAALFADLARLKPKSSVLDPKREYGNALRILLVNALALLK